jgi:hypothetical protein
MLYSGVFLLGKVDNVWGDGVGCLVKGTATEARVPVHRSAEDVLYGCYFYSFLLFYMILLPVLLMVYVVVL